MTKPAKVLIIGSGPIVIGQAAEFDYAGAQACKAMREEGVTSVLVNSNPATIMTDEDIADAVYIEPLTVDVLERVIAAVPGRQFTCPMHQEILQDGPGDCPICGMALEPVVVTEDEEDNSELIDMTRRFWMSLVLTVPVFLIAMGDLLPGRPVSAVLPATARPWVELFWPVPWCCGVRGRFSYAAGGRL